MKPNIAVLGAGSWGVALAQSCAAKGLPTIVIARRAEVVEEINTAHRSEYLPGIPLDPRLSTATDMAALANADIVLAVIPAQAARAALSAAAPHLKPGAALVLCQKGVERGSLALPHEVAREAAPNHLLAILTGPSFASDVASGLPTAVTIAAEDLALARTLQETLATRTFRPYPSTDIIGAQVGGALKNVLAIACGIVVAKGLGESARAALIARGYAEMNRLALAMGARAETLAGLSGLGDLALTCASTQSRNFSLGVRIGEACGAGQGGPTYEGAATAAAAVALAAKWNVETPICATVAAIVDNQCTVDEAVDALLERPLKARE